MFYKLIDTDIATLCAGCATPGHRDLLKNNAEFSGSTQICYTAYGSGIIETAIGNAEYSENNLTDLSSFRGLLLRGTAGPNGVIWVGINPKNERVIEYNFIKGESNTTFTGKKGVSILLCLRGQIVANNKYINELNFAVIKKDQVVDLSIPQNSTAIIFWIKE
jgi:hypothetical protein